MSYMDRENILTESQIDNILKLLRKDGKGKGAVAVTVTNAAKNYIVMLTLSGYSEVEYSGSVTIP